METAVFGTKVRSLYEVLCTLSYVVVDFRLVVFRPFVSEVLIGKVKSQDENGIRG